jgi:hypothetical protein
MRYRVVLPAALDRQILREKIDAFMASEEYLVAVARKRKKRVLDARRQVIDMGISGDHLSITNRFQTSGSMKISEILALFFPFREVRHLEIRKEEAHLGENERPFLDALDFALDSVLVDLSDLYVGSKKSNDKRGHKRSYMTVPYAE